MTALDALKCLAQANDQSIQVTNYPTGGIYMSLISAKGDEEYPRISMAAEDEERAAELLLQRIWRTAWENTSEDGLTLDPRRGERLVSSG